MDNSCSTSIIKNPVVADYLNPPRGKEFRSPYLLPVPITARKATTHPAGIWLAVSRIEKGGNSAEIRRLLLAH
jgi:hypothetical protein